MTNPTIIPYSKTLTKKRLSEMPNQGMKIIFGDTGSKLEETLNFLKSKKVSHFCLINNNTIAGFLNLRSAKTFIEPFKDEFPYLKIEELS